MKDYKQIIAKKLKEGDPVALYCYGIYTSYLLSYLKHFYGVLPTLVIDNDPRKRGTAEYGVPVMPFAEAQEQYENLQYFICSDDFKYTIIGDLLEQGVKPNSIINYVPVEKKKTCLYFYNRFLLTLTGKDNETQKVDFCNLDSLHSEDNHRYIPMKNGDYEDLKSILNRCFTDFENNRNEVCQSCVMNKEQYMVSREYQKHYKQVACYQEFSTDCLCRCIYCCVEQSPGVQMNSLESYSRFLKRAFSLGWIDDDFSCAIDMSERDFDQKVGVIVESLNSSGLTPLVYKVNSCLLVYSKHLAKLLKQGAAYVIWSLDAGTRETYKRIKQIDAFDKVVETVRKYIAADAFDGRFIVAKYLIVKGVNDNEEEFDAYLQLVTELGLSFVSLSFNFYVKAEETDLEFIRNCYQKILDRGLQLTYKNNSEAVTKALEMSNLLSQ